MRLITGVVVAAIFLELAGCSSQNQERAKDDAKKAGREIKEDAKDLSNRVSAAVQPDSRSASDKLQQGADRMESAASKAGVKLDRAALLAKVKTRIASDAGLSTLTKVDVSVRGSEVTLLGSVGTEQQKKAAEIAAGQVDGVTRVHNELIVQP